LGVLLQAAVLFIPLLRTGYKFQLRFDWRESGLGKAAKLAGWTIGLVLANQISYVVITRIATSANLVAAANGDVATGLTTYQKAHLIFVLPHSVIAVSLVTALLPMMSKLAHSKDFAELGRQISKYVGILISVMLPVSVLLGMTGPDLAAVMFGYGAAGIDAARATGMVVSALALGLPAYSLLYVLYRAWYSQENTRTPFFIAVILNLLNVALAIGFSAGVDNFARVTALGIAYSVAYNLVVILAWIWLRRTGIGLETKRNLVTGLKVLAASAVMALWVIWLPDLSDTVQSKMLLELALEWVSGLAIFLLLAKLFKITEIQQVLSTLAGKFARN
jgi:putative peptidoglycan lipid II flippase